MQAEFQIPSPLVPIRPVKFVRLCKQHGEDVWAVADVSIDTLLHGNVHVSCRRLPSGCIVRDMANGCSKVVDLIDFCLFIVVRVIGLQLFRSEFFNLISMILGVGN